MIPLEELVATVIDVAPDQLEEDDGPGGRTGWSSKQHIELVVTLEEQYGVGFSHEEIRGLRSLGAVREALRRKGVAV
ncbi:MAG: acyl carrier protein [Chloroflexi bacterium]|nr:MAG: acyl carrier protein [Chloroflexota bacterium]